MKKLTILLAVFFSVLAVSCEPEPVKVESSLEVTPNEISFEAAGNKSETITVTAENVKWSYEMSDEDKQWITVVETDEKTLTVTVSDNELAKTRSGLITIVPDNKDLFPSKVTIKQKGKEVIYYTFTVKPDAMKFAGEGAEAQVATVTVSHEELTWTAAPEKSIDDEWMDVSVADDKITVTVLDNPETAVRSGNVVITPSIEDVDPIYIRVTQEGKPLPPSLKIDLKEPYILKFPSKKSNVAQKVLVDAVSCNWNAETSDTPDVVGNKVEWIRLDVFNVHGVNYFLVLPNTNNTPEERTGYIIITSDVPGFENITLTVVQEASDKGYVSTLMGNVVIEDLESGSQNTVSLMPNRMGSVAFWRIELLAPDVEKGIKSSLPFYKGNGTRLHLNIYSKSMEYNDEENYVLPDGEYVISTNCYVPFGMEMGKDYGITDKSTVTGSWYLNVNGGQASDIYSEYTPFVSGKLTVARSGEDYTLTFDFMDDAENTITGTCVTKLDNMTVK